jgi:hypothetical protein
MTTHCAITATPASIVGTIIWLFFGKRLYGLILGWTQRLRQWSVFPEAGFPFLSELVDPFFRFLDAHLCLQVSGNHFFMSLSCRTDIGKSLGVGISNSNGNN